MQVTPLFVITACIAGAIPASSVAPGRDLYIELRLLDISGGTLPPGLLIRASTTQLSSGQGSITDLGGGRFHLEISFYVVAELSLDNGQTWVPADSGGQFYSGPDPLGPTPTRPITWGALKLLYR